MIIRTDNKIYKIIVLGGMKWYEYHQETKIMNI